MVYAARPPILARLEAVARRHTVVVVLSGFAMTALVLIGAMMRSRPDGQLHVWFLDVGHSNAALMQTPGGAQALVDGGRYPTRLLTAIGDRLPFYDRKIEILIISHPDEWDIAALDAVLERYEIGAWLYHGQVNHGEVFTEIQERLEQMGVERVEARAGYMVDFGDGATIEALHPPAAPSISGKLGDGVMALRVTYGEVSFLLTSDLSRAGQREMLARGISPVAAVMQVPQHGRARALDEEFLRLAQPQIAALQTDTSNRFGDPDPDTLDLLKGLRLFRTDEHGTIHFQTDGEAVVVHTDSPAENEAD